ncbi:tripartite tricarboxylate transporter substrate-binding protein [Pseudaestuariivita atlantica]|uniref:Transporter n=1 Tax=Pseudaestuariivita atlantica TaxID=1317121 RepID=A0A0L1JSY1_9RHOB|nr:tripartite tricarboxylate transporter substrate-binding protein [Pseudaestuariivita atlantica]KNG94889.1 transporter [Pseudaestuariivita atlantica]
MKHLLASAALAAMAAASPALAEYPDGPVQFIVPWPPGDFEDILTRMIADDMAKATGQSVSVVNRPGGGDGPFPGALEVLNAPNDGSVIGSFVIGVPVVGPKIDIGIEEDSFVPVGIFLTYPFVLAASGDAPYSNMAELAAYAQDNDVVLGHFGAGLTPTKVSFVAAKEMGFEFADDSAFDLLDCNTLSSGDADVINTTLALIEPCLDEINVLGSIGADPIEKLGGVQTLAAQANIAPLELWNGLFVTKGTPQEVIDTIAGVAEQTMASEAAQTLMQETGAAVYWQGQAEAQARIEADRATDAAFNAKLAE